MKKNEFYDNLPTHVKRAKDITSNQKNVLASIWARRNDQAYQKNNGIAISLQTLAEESKIAKDTVKNAVRMLYNTGYITVVYGESSPTAHKANKYTLTEKMYKDTKKNIQQEDSEVEKLKAEIAKLMKWKEATIAQMKELQAENLRLSRELESTNYLTTEPTVTYMKISKNN